jgi:hypothetical protein
MSCHSETARVMGLSVQTMKARICHERNKLRETLKRIIESAWMSRKRTARSGCNTEVVLSDAQIDAGKKIVLFLRRAKFQSGSNVGLRDEEDRHLGETFAFNTGAWIQQKACTAIAGNTSNGRLGVQTTVRRGQVVMLTCLFAALLAILGLMCFTGPDGIIGTRRRY